MIRALLLWLALVGPLAAEEVVLGLSRSEIAITATFDGSDILVFGAVKRDAPPPEDAPLDVVITIAGPSEPVDIRRKDRRLGIWVNTDAVHIPRAPSFYTVASTGPLTEVLADTEDLRHSISIPRAMRTVGATAGAGDVDAFVDALIRIRQQDALYQNLVGAVALDEETLFRTRVDLPANLTEGAYATRIFLVRGGKVVDLHETVIDVRKVGLERWLYAMAHDQPLAYGIMSLAIAIAAGWLASAAFRVLQR